eukprot:12940166-Heterocapsa_arctica.AAC.1
MASYGEVIPYWEESGGREDFRDSLAQKDEKKPQIAAEQDEDYDMTLCSNSPLEHITGTGLANARRSERACCK